MFGAELFISTELSHFIEITGLWSKSSPPDSNTVCLESTQRLIYFIFLLLPVKGDACHFPLYFVSLLSQYFSYSKIMWKSRECGARLKETNTSLPDRNGVGGTLLVFSWYLLTAGIGSFVCCVPCTILLTLSLAELTALGGTPRWVNKPCSVNLNGQMLTFITWDSVLTVKSQYLAAFLLVDNSNSTVFKNL